MNLRRESKEDDLHDEEEEEDDEGADVRVQPGRGAAQPRGGGGAPDLGPGEVVKQRVDALSGHELEVESRGWLWKGR